MACKMLRTGPDPTNFKYWYYYPHSTFEINKAQINGIACPGYLGVGYWQSRQSAL